MKKTIRMTESELHRMINESVKRVLNEEYNPFKEGEDENGDFAYPRYEQDTRKYRTMLPKQAKHLAEQISFFLKTLYHAFPSEKRGVANFHEDLQMLLVKSLYRLEDIYKPER